MLRAKRGIPAAAARLLRPQRLGIFGHRGVGKTTLLSLLYREAAAGRLNGCRLAAADAATAGHLAEKIRQLEAGQLLPGTLAETELRLNLYRGQTRIELVLKDYQGEHVELNASSATPIQSFLRDCDAIWLCIDASSLTADGLLRRQQEFEQLVESYLAREPALTIRRPFALVLTKADLLDEDTGRNDGWLEAVAMTRHTLWTHCPNSAVFAVSSLEHAAQASAAPTEHAAEPAFRLAPRNIDEPLAWLATALQRHDEELLAPLWQEHPRDAALLERCVEAFARRYPSAAAVPFYRQRLRLLRGRLRRRRFFQAVVAAAGLVLGLAGYDALGARNAARFEADHGDDPASVLSAWESYRHWHPTRHLLRPEAERAEQEHLRELAAAARRRAYEEKLATLGRRADDPLADAEALWQEFLTLRRDFPEADPADWEPLRASLGRQRDALRARKAREAFAELLAAEQRPTDLATLYALAERIITEYPGTPEEEKARYRRADYRARIDRRDIEEARAYTRLNPLHFQTRLEHYQRYLDRHPSGGCFAEEAESALRAIAVDWDRHDFAALRHQFEHRPGDLPDLDARCRAYLAAHPRGERVAAVNDLLRFSDRVRTGHDYRVTLLRGEFDKNIAHFFSFGPDLSVELEVAGLHYGPSSIVRNRYTPDWEFEFPRPIRWKIGDPVKIFVHDHDWGKRRVLTLESEENDPLAMRMLSGEVGSGPNRLVFASDFAMPNLAGGASER